MAEPRRRIRSLLSSFGCLTTGQIYQLLGIPRQWNPDDSRQRGIRCVLRRGEVSKPAAWHRGDVFKGRRHGRPQIEAVYWLDGRERRPSSLAHDVALSEVHLAYAGSLWQEHSLGHGGINPDALLYLPSYFYFVELERQRNSFKKKYSCINKARRYLEYKKHGNFSRHHPHMMDFYVLFIFAEDTEMRDSADEIRDNALHQFERQGLNFGRFKLATLEDVVENPHGPVWRSPNGTITAIP